MTAITLPMGTEPASKAATVQSSGPSQPGEAEGFLAQLLRLFRADPLPEPTPLAARAAGMLMPAQGQIEIAKGDTLSGLARQWGTTVDELMRLNPQIHDANLIFAGDRLTLPGGAVGSAEARPQPGAAAPATSAGHAAATPSADIRPIAGQGPVSDQLRTRYGDKADEVAAFLRMLRCAEGTEHAADPYRVVYGYGCQLKDLSQHPSLTGEWNGKVLPDHMCKAAGVPKGSKSKAAGAYQITAGTYRELIKDPALQAFGQLPRESFGRDMQERMACRLLERCGAMKHLLAGDMRGAVHAASNTWASLPGNHYEQGGRSMAQLEQWYAQSAR